MLIIRKKKLVLVSIIIVGLFLIFTVKFMNVLTESENKVIQTNVDVENKIRKILFNLPNNYKKKQHNTDTIEYNFIEYVNRETETINFKELWNETNSWVNKTQIYSIHPNLGRALYALKHAKIIKAELDNRGSQLKFLLTLEGNQQVVFKPKRYDKDEIIEGVVYAGKDRYGSEILGFYLSGIFEKQMVPISVERVVNIRNDLLSVATTNFLQTTFTLNSSTCIYGMCYYCTKNDPVCGNKSNLLSGAIIFNIKGNIKTHKSPWRRTYKKDKYSEWQTNNHYCKIVKKMLPLKRIYDIVDISIFDFLLQNGDRHHYETLNGNLIWLDNGKGLGNPHVDHMDILAPLYQCCLLRENTWDKLQVLAGGVLTSKLKLMPDIHNFVSQEHFIALERRLLIIYATVEYCMFINKEKHNIL